jgi:hypothetical protein
VSNFAVRDAPLGFHHVKRVELDAKKFGARSGVINEPDLGGLLSACSCSCSIRSNVTCNRRDRADIALAIPHSLVPAGPLNNLHLG